MSFSMMILAALLWPLVAAAVCWLWRSPRVILRWVCGSVLAEAVLVGKLVAPVMLAEKGRLVWGWFFVDALSAYHLAVMMIVFALSAMFAVSYFGAEIRSGAMRLAAARKFGGLWCGSLWAMILVLLSNNLGIMWVGIEATTLMTAFLICVRVTPASLEAMWKYLLMCSVGVAFAFMGTLLVAAAARALALPDTEVLLWTNLQAKAGLLNQPLLKLAFLFLLVGYGTKAGLAPLHNWLPDAHSQAPAPVSALFSGFLLNAALYCIMRYVAILEAATGGSGWSLRLVLVFGSASIVIAAAFIMFQENVKRLLAYHSVEHLGIIALGLGLGGLGTFAALFHVFNHSLCKTLAFISAGRIGQQAGSYEMARWRGTLRSAPVWGVGLLGAFLALIGVAPFALFMSELFIVKAAVDARAWLVLALFLAGSGIVFVGALRHALAMAWGEPLDAGARVPPQIGDGLIVLVTLGALLLAGLWLPQGVVRLLSQAAQIVKGG